MHQENLSLTIHVRVDPALHAELVDASEREGVAVGVIVRRAIRFELDGVEAHRLDPFVTLPLDEIEGQLVSAIQTIGSPSEAQQLVDRVGDECVEVMDAVAQVLDVVHDENAPQRFERAAGYLRQASEHLLQAAYRTKAIRVRQGIVSGELDRIEAQLIADQQAEERGQ